MARRVYLHIGPPKTGTSFLQAAWFQHRDDMAQQGLLYPGGQLMSQFRAAAVALEKEPVVARMPPGQRRAWDRLTSAVGAWDGEALLSSEHYSLGSAGHAKRIVDRLYEVADEVHVIVTARDLARQVPAGWQQQVKQGLSISFDEFWRTLANEPERPFWQGQDLPGLLARWTTRVPASHAHLVVHGRPGSPKDVLWNRCCQVLGIEPSFLRPGAAANESLGLIHTELLRRINADLPLDRDRLVMGRLTKTLLAREILEPAGTRVRMVLPGDAHEWLVERSGVMVEQLRTGDWDVVGRLEDLIPGDADGNGRTPDTVTDAELLQLATEACARLMLHELEERSKRGRLVEENQRLKRRLIGSTDRPASTQEQPPVRDRAERLVTDARRVAGRARDAASHRVRRLGVGRRR